MASRASGDPHPAAERIGTAWQAVNTVAPYRADWLAALLVRAETVLHSDDDPRPLRRYARTLRLRPVLASSRAERRELKGRIQVAESGQLSRRTYGTPRWGPRVRAAIRLTSPEMAGTARVGLGVMATGAVSHLLDLGHPNWAGVAAAAVLQPTNVQHVVHRTVQRAVGTVIGAILGFGLLVVQLPNPVLIGCIVGLLFCAEMTVLRNYGYAMLFVTPLTMLMAYFVTPGDATVLAWDRGFGTVVGAALGLVTALVVPGRRYVAELRRALDRVDEANARLARATPDDLPDARHHAVQMVLALRRLRDITNGEPIGSALPDQALTAEQEAYALIARATRTLARCRRTRSRPRATASSPTRPYHR